MLDEWFESEVKPRLKGEADEIRFADDAILCFQHKEDAEKVLEVLPKRFEKYGLTLHPEKTRLIEFGRYAAKNVGKPGKKKPATFNFLGFVHICARSRQGKFTVHVKTIAKRLGRGLKAVWQWCKQHRHDPVSEQQKTLNAKLRGHYQYYGRSSNYRAIRQFYVRVLRIWREWAEPPDTCKAADMGTVCRNTTAAPAPTTSDHTHLGEHREARLKNPLREICTVGSVRGENYLSQG